MKSRSPDPRPPCSRVLLAEDEPMVARAIKMALALDGLNVDIAENGELALKKFVDGQYDLVITDFTMAKMDGLELAKAIKKACPSIPIIMITAHSEVVSPGGAAVPNIDLLLGKPFSFTELRAALARVCATGKKHSEKPGK